MSFLSKGNMTFQRNENIKAKLKHHLAWWSPDRSLQHSPKQLQKVVSCPADGPRAKGRCQGHKEILLLSPSSFL